MHYEVIVIGGGPAGVAAAVSAARQGCTTALLEENGFLGGTATGGLVLPISGFFHKERQVVGGIGWEVVERLLARGAAKVEYPKGHVSYHPEYLKAVYQELAQEAGVDLYTNCRLTGCTVEENRITGIAFQGKSGEEWLTGDDFIDASGDGALCYLAGVPMLPGDGQEQPMSLCFLLTGVDVTTPLLKNCIHHDGKSGASCNAVIHDYLQSCVDEGKLDQFGGPWFNTVLLGDALAVNVTRAAADATDRASYNRAELRMRRDVFVILDLLKEKFPEFRNASVVSSAVHAGIRESRRIVGLETVTGSDLLSGKVPECPVARCAHPMDIHIPGGNGQRLIPLEKPAYIPHTALIPKNVSNLAAAGRCVSADREAFATLRVQATCMAMGESAGLLAALANKHSCAMESVPSQELKAAIAEKCVVL